MQLFDLIERIATRWNWALSGFEGDAYGWSWKVGPFMATSEYRWWQELLVQQMFVGGHVLWRRNIVTG